MGGMFHGAAVITLDAKGRLAIPTRHREPLLAARSALVLTAHPEGCALVYPEAEWEPVRAQVEKFPAFHAQAAWWKRLLLGFEEHVQPDGSGRILISPALRKFADLKKTVVFAGVRNRIEIWDTALSVEMGGQTVQAGVAGLENVAHAALAETVEKHIWPQHQRGRLPLEQLLALVGGQPAALHQALHQGLGVGLPLLEPAELELLGRLQQRELDQCPDQIVGGIGRHGGWASIHRKGE